ncbi:MAG: fumarylacetoacetate hydrolase family protein [Clostridiales bacterium]|nr:fumarylacetoacetate hydrolase family protein [Clostridiales bacterium]
MKLITCIYNSSEIIALLSENEREVYPLSQFGIKSSSMNELISEISSEDLVKAADTDRVSEKIPVSNVKLLAPIPVPKQDIICLGVNYTEHAKESARYKLEKYEGDREYPVYFSKRVNEALPHNGSIDLKITSRLDYEAELAVIIGRDAYNVKAEDAENYIFGYTILNDISARDIQMRHKQWYMGKSLTGFCPMGPCIVTKDEIHINDKLKISSKVNGEIRQNSSTDLMIFKPDYIIEELSSYALLKAGTIISTGTPAGVGMGFNPPKFLNKGDIVDCGIEKIGKLTTYIK